MPSAKQNILDKIIFFLIVIVGGIIIYNQSQFASLSTNIILNAISFLLIFGLIGFVTWLALKSNSNGDSNVSGESKAETETLQLKVEGKAKEGLPFSIYDKISFGFIALIAILVMFNQFQISQATDVISGSLPTGRFASVSFNSLKAVVSGVPGKGVVIGPQLNPNGRTTKLVEWPTISEAPQPKKTGNPTQDAISTVVPTGTPFYALQGEGGEKIKGVSFDDPLTSQKVWASLLGSKRFGRANEIQLTPDEETRWKKLISVFTCDYCCGGPNSVTTINRCGCAHSYAWQGMAKFFIRYYPNYSDEEVLGEMTKWKGLWYPQGMIQDYLVYTGQQPATILTHGGSVGIKEQFLQQAPAAQQKTHSSVTPLDDLPSMVGGC